MAGDRDTLLEIKEQLGRLSASIEAHDEQDKERHTEIKSALKALEDRAERTGQHQAVQIAAQGWAGKAIFAVLAAGAGLGGAAIAHALGWK